jgi:hypothetical protein
MIIQKQKICILEGLCNVLLVICTCLRTVEVLPSKVTLKVSSASLSAWLIPILQLFTSSKVFHDLLGHIRHDLWARLQHTCFPWWLACTRFVISLRSAAARLYNYSITFAWTHNCNLMGGLWSLCTANNSLPELKYVLIESLTSKDNCQTFLFYLCIPSFCCWQHSRHKHLINRMSVCSSCFQVCMSRSTIALNFGRQPSHRNSVRLRNQLLDTIKSISLMFSHTHSVSLSVSARWGTNLHSKFTNSWSCSATPPSLLVL